MTVSRLDNKDLIIISISFASFCISLITYLQKNSEGKISLRKQMTDTMEKLTDLNIEVDKSSIESEKSKYPQRYVALINDQRRFLIRQAIYISKKIGNYVSPFEYLLIAGVCDGLSMVDESEYYFKVAIKKSRGFEKGFAERQYGRFLFRQNREVEGRVHFGKCFHHFSGSTNGAIFARAESYERWAKVEDEHGYSRDAADLLESAIDEYGKMTQVYRRDSNIRRVRSILDKVPL